MEIIIRKIGEIYIIDVKGEMDLYNSNRLTDLANKIMKENIQSIILNLDQVDYIDSAGIGALIFICSNIKKMNRKLGITNIHDPIMKVIALTKLKGFFPIMSSMEEALQLMKG